MVDPSRTPAPVSQAVILFADQVYQTNDGKWVICGTHSFRWTTKPKMVFPNDQQALFVRILLDTGGNHSMRLTVVDAFSRPGKEKVLQEARGQINVLDPKASFEFGMVLPLKPLPCPVKKKDLKVGHPVAVTLLVQLEIDDHSVASSNLRLVFCHPKDPNGPQSAQFAQVHPIERPSGSGD